MLTPDEEKGVDLFRSDLRKELNGVCTIEVITDSDLRIKCVCGSSVKLLLLRHALQEFTCASAYKQHGLCLRTYVMRCAAPNIVIDLVIDRHSSAPPSVPVVKNDIKKLPIRLDDDKLVHCGVLEQDWSNIRDVVSHIHHMSMDYKDIEVSFDNPTDAAYIVVFSGINVLQSEDVRKVDMTHHHIIDYELSSPLDRHLPGELLVTVAKLDEALETKKRRMK